MLNVWPVVAGIAATLVALRLRRILCAPAEPAPVSRMRSVSVLLPETEDHDTFHSHLSEMQIKPTEIEIGPKLGSGTFGRVYRGEELLQYFSNFSVMSQVALVG